MLYYVHKAFFDNKPSTAMSVVYCHLIDIAGLPIAGNNSNSNNNNNSKNKSNRGNTKHLVDKSFCLYYLASLFMLANAQVS